MQPIFRIKLLLAIIVTLICTQGCVDSKPIETSTVIDDRPVIMFSFEGTIPAQAIGIYVDNLYMGEAQKYQKGKLGLKIIAAIIASIAATINSMPLADSSCRKSFMVSLPAYPASFRQNIARRPGE